MPLKRTKSQGKRKLTKKSNKVSPELEDDTLSKVGPEDTEASPTANRAGTSVPQDNVKESHHDLSKVEPSDTEASPIAENRAGSSSSAPQGKGKKSRRRDRKSHHRRSGKKHRHAGFWKRHRQSKKSDGRSVASQEVEVDESPSEAGAQEQPPPVPIPAVDDDDDDDPPRPAMIAAPDKIHRIKIPHAKTLEGLDEVSRIYIRPAVQVPIGFNRMRKYHKAFDVLNDNQRLVFYAFEITRYTWKEKHCCCKPDTHQFGARIYTYMGAELMNVDGDVGKNTSITVSVLENGNKEVLGILIQDPIDIQRMVLDAFSASGELIFKVIDITKGPIKNKKQLWQKEYTIVSADGSVTYGEVRQKWTPTVPMFPEWFAEGFTFGVAFDLDFSVHTKTMFLALALVLYFVMYEARVYKTPKLPDRHDHSYHPQQRKYPKVRK